MRRALYVLAITLGLIIAGTTGAVANHLITSADVANGSLRGVDIHDGTVRFRDLGYGVTNRVRSGPSFRQVQALNLEIEHLQRTLCTAAEAGELTINPQVRGNSVSGRAVVNRVAQACADFEAD